MDHPTAVVGFVGQNENGILRHLTHGLMTLLEPHGYSGHVIDLADPGWAAQFEAVLQGPGVAMAWGHAGVGARLDVNGDCLWDRLKVPFVSVLADPPCWRPVNHCIRSRYVVNAYLYPEWLRVQRQFIRAPQLSTLVQPGLVPNPARDLIPWRDRPRRMVLVKTGGDAGARRTRWASMPRRWRAVLEDAGTLAAARPTGDITDIVLAAAEAHNLVPEQRTDLLFALMTEVDLFVRETRSTALATALLGLPVDIHGRGWEHVSRTGGRARFLPAFDAAGLPELYAETQFMLNTTPNFASGLHERVAYGLDARCCVVSDENDYTRRALAGVPTFFGIDPLDAGLADRLDTLFHGDVDYTDMTGAGLDLVLQEFDGARYMLALLDLAAEVRMGERLTEYRH